MHSITTQDIILMVQNKDLSSTIRLGLQLVDLEEGVSTLLTFVEVKVNHICIQRIIAVIIILLYTKEHLLTMM